MEVNIQALNSTAFSVSSVQLAYDNLFYLMQGPYATIIAKYNLNTAEETIVYNATAFIPKQIKAVVNEENGNTDLWVRDSVGRFYVCYDESCNGVTTIATVHNGDSILDFGLFDYFVYFVIYCLNRC